MALTDYVIMPGADYQAICDKIRDKTGKVDPIKSGDLVGEIDSIIGGGGGNEDGLVTRSLTSYTNNTADSIGITAFYNYQQLTDVSFLNVTHCNARAFEGCSGLISANIPRLQTADDRTFNGCSSLATVEFPELTEVVNSMFYQCYGLSGANFPVANKINAYAFYGCKSLTDINIPSATAIDTEAFNGCSSLVSAVFPVLEVIGTRGFYKCSKLSSLTLGVNNGAICRLGSNGLQGTAIASGNGYIYVPAEMVDTYKDDSVWSTYADQILPIE